MKNTSTATQDPVDRTAGTPATGVVGRTIRGFGMGALTPFRLISGIREILSTLREDATEECSARITGAILCAVFILSLGWKWVWIVLLATNAADCYFVSRGRNSTSGQH
jgi:hypothetical protein